MYAAKVCSKNDQKQKKVVLAMKRASGMLVVNERT